MREKEEPMRASDPILHKFLISKNYLEGLENAISKKFIEKKLPA